MGYFSTLLDGGFEGLHLFSDRKTGLRALVGIHSTRLGPALGGTRALSTYATEEAAAHDVLRLARGMTYKAAFAGLPHGGGKAVLMLPPAPFDRAALFQAFGRAVDSLGGRYVTTEDSGTSPEDMEQVRQGTRHVVGLAGGSGDPSPFTALGVVRGMEAVARHVFGRADLAGRRVTLMGVGHVGYALARELHQRGAKLFVCDIHAAAVARAVKEFGATPLREQELLEQEADIYAPCALGGAINDATVGRLKVKAVAGAANNQLAEPRHGVALADRGILYAPDYAINAGGLINVSLEVSGYDAKAATARVEKIYDAMDALFTRARDTQERPEQVADRTVEERL